MKRETLYYAIFSLFVIIFCAVTAMRVFAGNLSGEKAEKKKHSSVRITKSLITKYKTNGGERMVLTFKETSGGHIKLVMTGFSKDESVCVQEELETVRNNVLQSYNVFFGIISKDESGKTLHELFAAGPEQDWVLSPVPYDATGKYVSYQIEGTGPGLAAVGRLNPSPPAR